MDTLQYLARTQQPASVTELLAQLERDMGRGSLSCPLDLVSPFPNPNGAYVLPRRHEIAAAINRYRKLGVLRKF